MEIWQIWKLYISKWDYFTVFQIEINATMYFITYRQYDALYNIIFPFTFEYIF